MSQCPRSCRVVGAHPSPQIRRAARELLKLDDKDPKRLFEGNALIRRLVRIGVLDDTRMRLDYVLALKTEDFMERRLQTQVFKSGLAKSVHHARVLIRQRHIRVGKQMVNVPSFVVRLDSQKVRSVGISYGLRMLIKSLPIAPRLRPQLAFGWWTTGSSEEEASCRRRRW